MAARRAGGSSGKRRPPPPPPHLYVYFLYTCILLFFLEFLELRHPSSLRYTQAAVQSSANPPPPVFMRILLFDLFEKIQVIDGMDVVKVIEAVGTSSGKTSKPVVIADCGQLE